MNWIAKFVGWFGLALSWIIVHLPHTIQNAVGSALGLLWFDVFRIRRDVVLANIERAFPEMSEQDRIKLGRRALENFGRNIVDYAYLPFLDRQNFRSLFEARGLDVLDNALKEGRGVILLTLHLGHGDLACACLSLMGYPVYMVSKFFKLRWLNDLWFGMRRRLGTEFIPPRDSSFALLRALKKNGLVVFPLDQFTGPPIGVKTKFFGHETGTAAGLAMMAQRARCPVVAGYTWRTPDGKHQICVTKRIDVTFGENRDLSLTQYTQSFNDLLEEIVRKHPDQWMWIHKRWKKFVVN
jgi:KDO2-lipid IV(A) lauroyltransferase